MGGNWMVALPSPASANISENAYAMMPMAAEIGIRVPETKLGLYPVVAVLSGRRSR